GREQRLAEVLVGSNMSRIALDHRAEGPYRAVVVAERREDHAEIEIGGGPVRPAHERTLIGARGICEAMLRLQRDAQVVMRLAVGPLRRAGRPPETGAAD